jgi:hypothetical protein
MGLPAISRLKTTLTETVLAPRFAETFDLKRGRWEPNVGLVRLGDAVRTTEGRRLFGVVDSMDSGRVMLRRGSYQLVKHLSAQILRIPLVEYDPEQRQLSVPLGAELPWLYERVAVLCSGRRAVRVGSRLHYELIPPDVAQGLWDRLAPEARSLR